MSATKLHTHTKQQASLPMLFENISKQVSY
jgi:hypothetical protein